MSIKSYSELIALDSYEERFLYLQMNGQVAHPTFGGSRYLNQAFYTSIPWRRFRNQIIRRDHGCDLAFPGYEIYERLIIHHINSISKKDCLEMNLDVLMNPENCVSTAYSTHNALHYGGTDILDVKAPIERRPNDTVPWRS